ncbi:MAG: diguanylate cyclase domain-containing protein [Lachnospiraceae bacterium]
MEEQKLIETIEELKKQLSFLQKKYCFVIDNIDCAIWEYDCNTHFLHLEKKIGGKYENENLDIPDYRNTIRGWGMIHPDDMAIFEAYCDSMDNGEECYSYDFRSLTDDETYTWQRYEGNTIRDENGNIIKIIGKTINVDREYKEREELKRQSRMDSLTGLLNKGAFQEEMAKTFSRYQRGLLPELHAVYIMDVDNFKGINDTYGHLFGDYVLEEYAAQLKDVFREEAIIGRIGGDEFAVVKKIVSIYEAEKYAKQFMYRIRKMQLKNHAKITTSIGISMFPADGYEGTGLFRAADIALYDVKNHSKDGYAFYNEGTQYAIKKETTVNSNNSNSNELSMKEDNTALCIELEKQVKELLQEKYFLKQMMGKDLYYYVVGENYQLQYKNGEKTDGMEVCYRQFGLDAPCKDCPIHFVEKYGKRYHLECYDKSVSRWYSKTAIRMNGKNGQTQYSVCREDITRFLERQNSMDHLTSLFTVDSFETKSMKILSENENEYCMVCLGYKNFYDIDTRYGYKAENEILKMTGRLLKYSLMEGEIAARTQGADFILLLKNEKSVFDRVHMIMKALQHECNLRYPGFFANMESGVYNIEDHSMPVVMAMDYACYAKDSLHGLKKRKQNEFALFDEQLNKQFQKEDFICRNMYQAFLDEEFEIFFNPKKNEAGKVIETAVLSEWRDGKGHIWKEKDYIPVFEKRHFICDFDLNLYEKVFSYLHDWQKKGFEIPVVSLYLTFSGFWDRGFFDHVQELMNRFGIAYHQLLLVLDHNRFADKDVDVNEMAEFLNKKGFMVKQSKNNTMQCSDSLELFSAVEFEKLLK